MKRRNKRKNIGLLSCYIVWIGYVECWSLGIYFLIIIFSRFSNEGVGGSYVICLKERFILRGL